MGKSVRLTLIAAGVVVTLVALGYALSAMNLMELLISVHAPPPH